MAGGSGTIKVLHVDDEPEFTAMAAEFLRRADDRLEIQTVTDAGAGLEALQRNGFDCVVSDYDMPGKNGLEFLREVRSRDRGIPFILFTGKGSEEVASQAISAGVSDYMQKAAGTDRYELLAKRIRNHVVKRRATEQVRRTELRYQRLIEGTTDVIVTVDADGRFDYLSPSSERILGYEPHELHGRVGFDYLHPEDLSETMEQFRAMVEEPTYEPLVEFRFRRLDGSWVRLEARGRNLLHDELIGGIVVYSRDVTERWLQAERAEAVFEKAFDAIVIADDDGAYVAVNAAACDLFELEEDELLGRNITDFVPEGYDFEAAWDRFQASTRERGLIPLVGAGGTERVVEYAATADIVPGQHLSILRDVTEQRAVEAELEALAEE